MIILVHLVKAQSLKGGLCPRDGTFPWGGIPAGPGWQHVLRAAVQTPEMPTHIYQRR